MSRETDVAWAAGLFEGEGCFGMIQTGRGCGVIFSCTLQMTDEDVVRRFHQIVEVGRVSVTATGTGKTLWRWVTRSRADYRTVTALLRPHLGVRRRMKIVEMNKRLREVEL